ncbi:MAG: hypothetical protein M1457_09650 [bacterium]|nr:hypothetical protein [bacterium]
MMRKALIFALVYMLLSLLIEAALIVVVGWRVPADNARIAAIILVLPPLLAAWLTGYRHLKPLLVAAWLACLLTLILSVAANRLTGIKTGLIEPILTRLTAGFLAALATIKILGR